MSEMTSAADPVLCASCEIEVIWPPVEQGGLRYCCSGCAMGGPCCCSYDEPRRPGSAPPEAEADRRTRRRGARPARAPQLRRSANDVGTATE